MAGFLLKFQLGQPGARAEPGQRAASGGCPLLSLNEPQPWDCVGFVFGFVDAARPNDMEPWAGGGSWHGCCWEAFCIVAYCGLVGNPHLNC